MPPEATDGRVRCPQCQTTRLRVLKKIDRIERMYGNRFMNRMRARRGDAIYHCVYCRLQFYDPRKPGSATRENASNGRPEQPSASQETAEAERAAVPVIAAAPPAAPAPLPDVTIFGAAVTIHGSIRSSEDIYVEGRIEGTLSCREHRITIGPNARVKAKVSAADLEVLGTLCGKLQIESKTILRNGSSVVGDIRTADIVIEDGANFKGSVDLIRKQPQLPLG